MDTLCQYKIIMKDTYNLCYVDARIGALGEKK